MFNVSLPRMTSILVNERGDTVVQIEYKPPCYIERKATEWMVDIHLTLISPVSTPSVLSVEEREDITLERSRLERKFRRRKRKLQRTKNDNARI